MKAFEKLITMEIGWVGIVFICMCSSHIKFLSLISLFFNVLFRFKFSYALMIHFSLHVRGNGRLFLLICSFDVRHKKCIFRIKKNKIERERKKEEKQIDF